MKRLPVFLQHRSATVAVSLCLMLVVAACAAPDVEVMAIANEGFLVRAAGRAVLVDALFRATAPFPKFYSQAPSENLLETMINGGGVFEEIDLVLVTHSDPDHFHAPAVMRFMLSHPESTLIAPEDVRVALADVAGFDEMAARIQAPAISHGDCIELAVDTIELKVCRLHHSGERELANNLYRVDLDGFSFIHEGDAERDPKLLESLGLKRGGLDLAMLHDWYVFSDEGREILTTILNPRQVLLMHHRWDAAAESRQRIAEFDFENGPELPPIHLLGAETARISFSPHIR